MILYAHDPSRLRERYWTLPGSTPAGLFALSLMGEDVRDDDWRSVIELISEREPSGRLRRPGVLSFGAYHGLVPAATGCWSGRLLRHNSNNNHYI